MRYIKEIEDKIASATDDELEEISRIDDHDDYRERFHGDWSRCITCAADDEIADRREKRNSVQPGGNIFYKKGTSYHQVDIEDAPLGCLSGVSYPGDSFGMARYYVQLTNKKVEEYGVWTTWKMTNSTLSWDFYYPRGTTVHITELNRKETV